MVLPREATVRATKAKIFKIEVAGDSHILERLDDWRIPQNSKIKAVDIDECVLGHKRCTAIIFEVPDKKKPGHTQQFALVKADVVLAPVPEPKKKAH